MDQDRAISSDAIETLGAALIVSLCAAEELSPGVGVAAGAEARLLLQSFIDFRGINPDDARPAITALEVAIQRVEEFSRSRA